jgi:hypothetical protein
MKNNLYTILPPHVKHLEIPLADLEKLKTILELCKNLSTITVYHPSFNCKQTMKIVIRDCLR